MILLSHDSFCKILWFSSMLKSAFHFWNLLVTACKPVYTCIHSISLRVGFSESLFYVKHFFKVISVDFMSLGSLCTWWRIWPLSDRNTCSSSPFVSLPVLWTCESDGEALLPGMLHVWFEFLQGRQAQHRKRWCDW